MKRFRILNSKQDVVFKADTTMECYNFLKKQDMGLNSFNVECLIDDIEVNADEFISTFEEGERPEDLQFF